MKDARTPDDRSTRTDPSCPYVTAREAGLSGGERGLAPGQLLLFPPRTEPAPAAGEARDAR